MNLSRRTFLQLTASGISASSLTALGFSPTKALAEVRTFKLAHTSETRNTCPYCSVGCGVILYGMGDRAKNARTRDHPRRGGPRSPGQPRHPLPEGRVAPRLRPQSQSPQVSRIPCAGRGGVEARQLGLGARPHRPPDERRPGQELRRQERRRHGQPVAHDRLPRRLRLLGRIRVHHQQGHPRTGDDRDGQPGQGRHGPTVAGLAPTSAVAR